MTASYAYLAILAVHLAALALFGGMVLMTQLRLVGLGMRSYSIAELMSGLRIPKRIGFVLAVVSGAVLFAAHPEQYTNNPWFWTKLALLLSLGVNYILFERGLRKPKLA